MKLPVLLLAGSLLANVALFAVFALRPALAPPAFRDYFARSTAPANDPADPVRARRAAEAQAKREAAQAGASQAHLWTALQSDDLTTLVARLRAAGFSPALVRAIVSAQIEKNFSARMQALMGPVGDTPFWKPEPMNSMNNTKFFEEYNQIYRDRSKLLRQVLGADFFPGSDTDPLAAQRRQYGDLPPARIDLIQRINDDYAELTSQVRSAMQGITLPEDREKLALLEREKRADLAAILTPQELEAFEMRTSAVSARLRPALTLMDATEDEFRTLFRIQQQFNDQLNPPTGLVITTDFLQQRRDATNKMAEQIKAALGDARYADYARSSSSEFQQLNRLGQRENISNDVILRTYSLRDTASQESARIVADPATTPADKRTALQTLGQNTRTQILSSLGPTAGNGYIQSAPWVAMLERGAGVLINPDGTATTRPMPAPPPAERPRN